MHSLHLKKKTNSRVYSMAAINGLTVSPITNYKL